MFKKTRTKRLEGSDDTKLKGTQQLRKKAMMSVAARLRRIHWSE